MSLQVNELTKVYGTQKAVDAISFHIHKGEIVGFLGPNGAGKSTTLKMITGYLPPDAGEVLINGINVRKQPLEAKRVGYLPESNPLYYDMYVREYLDFIADLHSVPTRRVTVSRIIEKVGLKPESKKRIGQLSKGYKQRVGLAAALLHNPDVLILDEPTSGLDPNQIGEIRKVIKEQGKDKIVLFSSHILGEIEAICDRVIIISKGKIVADDTLSSLQSINKSKQLVKVQFAEAVDVALLEGGSGADRVEETGANTFKLQTAHPDTVRKRILELALQHHLNIVSLQSENESLEEVFKSLTKA